MAKTICRYRGNLRVEARFEENGDVILTDAPKKNKGKGEKFSPTDLLAAAQGNCLLTMMGYVAEKQGINLNEARVEVDKEMVGPPYHVVKLRAVVYMPAGLNEHQRKEMERFAQQCPVHHSLAEQMEKDIEFVYPD
jgi:putative redox protein